jgi:thiamine pyrophosphokinase
MSSHHIVKDKQEPALMIANGEACAIGIVHQLLEWSPYVVVLDGAIDRVLELGIKIDLFCGDFDSHKISLDNLGKIQYPIEIISTPNQYKTDLEKGLDILLEKGFPAVNIIWATGKRSDHFLSNLSVVIAYQNKIKITLLDDHGSMYPIQPFPKVFKKWFNGGTNLSLLPFPVASDISTVNLRYPLNSEELALGVRLGNSNQVNTTGMVEIKYQTGNLLIMECRD